MYTDRVNRVSFFEVNYFSFNGCCQESDKENNVKLIDMLEIQEDSNWTRCGKATGMIARMISDICILSFIFIILIRLYWSRTQVSSIKL